MGAPAPDSLARVPATCHAKSGALPAPTRQPNGNTPKAKTFSAVPLRYLRMPSF